MKTERSNRRGDPGSPRSVASAELERRRRPSGETALGSARRMHQTDRQLKDHRAEAEARQTGIESEVLNRAAVERAASNRAAERSHLTIRRPVRSPDESDVNLFEALLTRKPDEESDDTTGADTFADPGMAGAVLPEPPRSSVFTRSYLPSSGHSQSSPRFPTSRHLPSPPNGGLKPSSSAASQSLSNAESERKEFTLHVQTRDIGGVQLQAKPQGGGWHVRLKPDDPSHYVWLTQSRAAIERGLSRDLKSVITLELLE